MINLCVELLAGSDVIMVKELDPADPSVLKDQVDIDQVVLVDTDPVILLDTELVM